MEMTDDEKIDFVASGILKGHKAAFLELAKLIIISGCSHRQPCSWLIPLALF